MANEISPSLYQKICRKNNFQRVLDVTILCLLLWLLIYRFLTLNNHGFAWFLAFLCESWFTFIWVLAISAKWSPVSYKTHPEQLLQRFPEKELPAVDMFVTTADSVLEPPIMTINTVISLLAVDYPPEKLACYVSDDGCSPLTYYSLVEASEFAKDWIPFCKRYNVKVRAPFRYFSTDSFSLHDFSLEFQLEWKTMKDKYEQLSRKLNDAVLKPVSFDLTGEFAVFSNVDKRNHPTIIKVILENKEGISGVLPQLVYISRQKLPKHPHHYKAGAMNVLTRVSGLMTNAPFILNVDCDMFANNPQIVQHAMCFLLGSVNERESGYVQCPQVYYDGLKDDPFGNQFVFLQEYLAHGIGGIQGPCYLGTGCFHRRKIIYGGSPDDAESEGVLDENKLLNIFGCSKDLIKSATIALNGKTGNPSNSLADTHRVADCDYECTTGWGTKVGWLYGSATEDAHTGLMIHTRGWKSVLCTPNPPAFLGCAVSGWPSSLIQMKRWATGFLEILFSKNSPIFCTLYGNLQFRQCLGYLWQFIWGLRSIFELCYAALPAYCIIANSTFLPKVEELAINIPISLFVIYNIYTLLEYRRMGLSVRAWWNNQRMVRITSTCSWLVGFLSIILKIIGLSETVFEVTQKEQSSDGGGDEANAGRFTFNESPIFVPGTTLVLLHLMSMALGLFGVQPPKAHGGQGSLFVVWLW